MTKIKTYAAYSAKLTKVVKKPYTGFLPAPLSTPYYPSYSPHPTYEFSHPDQTSLQKSPNDNLKEAL